MSETRELAAHVFERDPLNWYVEPPWATGALMQVETFEGLILDPSCGQGNIVTTLRKGGYAAYGSDIACRVPRGTPWFCGCLDFLGEPMPPVQVHNIVMNPPFFHAKGAEAFIRRALALAERKVCAFVDTRFLNGAARAAGLYRDHPPARVWMISPRPSCPPGEHILAGGKIGGGTADYAWIVWDRDARNPGTRMGWLNWKPEIASNES